MVDRMVLYKACKYEAENFTADHGMNTAELWAVVNGRAKDAGGVLVGTAAEVFWFNTVLDDYTNRRV